MTAANPASRAECAPGCISPDIQIGEAAAWLATTSRAERAGAAVPMLARAT